MPKLTSDFEHKQDYKESFQSTADRPVYIGHPADLAAFKQNIDQKQKDSEYFGCILFPERKSRNDVWDYEKNKAFFAGIIDSHRSVILVSSLEHFTSHGTTVDELFWLQDNGYVFKPLQGKPIQVVAIQEHILDRPQITDYNKGRGTEKMPSRNARRRRFVETIKKPTLLLLSQQNETPFHNYDHKM